MNARLEKADVPNYHVKQSGTTLTIVTHHPIENKVWIAWVGDSLAVMGRQVMGQEGVSVRKDRGLDLTFPHKPNTPSERLRITNKGGVITGGTHELNPARLHVKINEPGLAMSRSIGDIEMSHVGLVATPDVKCFDLDDSDMLKTKFIKKILF